MTQSPTGQDGQGMPDGLPCLVLLAGTLCDHRIFTRQRRALRGVARVVVPDYAQLGAPGLWADTLLRRLPPKFSVAGFSLGGLWALELLRRAPERIERLAMIASNAQAAGTQARRKSSWLRKMWRDRGPAEVARQVKPGYFYHEAARRRHAKLVHDMALATPRRTAFAQFAWAAGRPDGRAELAAFRGASLFVSGAKDRLCPPAWQRAMCTAQPHAQWLELARVGHFVPLEAPAALNAALLRWMGR